MAKIPLVIKVVLGPILKKPVADYLRNDKPKIANSTHNGMASFKAF